MKLIVFHQLLIAAAIIFMVGYGGWELYDYGSGGSGGPVTPEAAIMEPGSRAGVGALYTGLAMMVGAGVLSVYLYKVNRRYAGQMSGF